MKRKISYLVALPLLSVFMISEINNLNGQTFLNSRTLGDTPYIEDGTVASIVPNSVTQDSVKISFEIIDTADYDFWKAPASYVSIASLEDVTGGQNDLSAQLALLPSESNRLDNQYVFQADGLSETTWTSSNEYNLVEVSGQGLVDTTGTVVPVPIDNGDFTTEGTTYTGTGEIPTIKNVDTNNSVDSIHDITYSNSNVTFKLDGINLPDTFGVTVGIYNTDLQDHDYQTLTANKVSDPTEGDDAYTYQMDASNLIDGGYIVYDIVNSGATVGTSTSGGTYKPDASITMDDLGITSTPQFSVTQGAVVNPYIDDNGFQIISGSETASSIQFTLHVVDNTTSDFENALNINNSVSVEMSEDGGANQLETADWKGDSTNNTYTFIIDGLNPETNYEIISLEDTGLAVGDSANEVDDSITVDGDLSGNGSFTTTSSNPYIDTDGFVLDESSITNYSAEFSLTIVDDNDSFLYENGFNVKMKAGATTEDHYADFVSVTGDTYTYKFNDLEASTSYDIISLEDTGLAVGEGNDIDDSITMDEIGTGIDSTFSTLANPYLDISQNGGITVDKSSASKDTIEFTLYAQNYDINDSYKTNDMKIKLSSNGKTNTYNTDFVSHGDGTDAYTYRITGLSEDQSYQIYSLVDSGLASSSTGDVESEITFDVSGGDASGLQFSTENVFNFLWLLLPFFILLIAGIVGGYFFWSKSRKNESSRLNILKRGK